MYVLEIIRFHAISGKSGILSHQLLSVTWNGPVNDCGMHPIFYSMCHTVREYPTFNQCSLTTVLNILIKQKDQRDNAAFQYNLYRGVQSLLLEGDV